jgi:hypothetical protein
LCTTRPLSGRVVPLLAAALLGCGGAGDLVSPPGGARTLTVALTLSALDVPAEGRYEIWAVDAAGQHRSLGRLDAGGTLTVPLPAEVPVSVEVTLEQPGDVDAVPSAQLLLRGVVQNGHADLTYMGAVTQGGLPARPAPGQFTMFSPSDNDTAGYPSHEESGIWLFNMAPGETAQRDYYVRMTQLQPGWTYEGWMVRDIEKPSAIWLSYGKFVPDWTGALNQPDDTGWGPFSGVLDYHRARLEDFPGDDWISNPLQLPWRAELTLPLDLRGKDGAGHLRWTHVVSIEPATDRGEPVTSERPFFMRPYADPFGDLGPGVPRTITFHGESMPRGTAEVR